MGAFSLIVLIFTAIIFCVATISIAQFFVKKTKNSQKGLAYECGIPSEGSSWAAQFNVGYYLFALIFLIFDVELIFMYPWALTYSDFINDGAGIYVLASMGFFLAVFAFGLFWEVKSKALEWE